MRCRVRDRTDEEPPVGFELEPHRIICAACMPAVRFELEPIVESSLERQARHIREARGLALRARREG